MQDGVKYMDEKNDQSYMSAKSLNTREGTHNPSTYTQRDPHEYHCRLVYSPSPSTRVVPQQFAQLLQLHLTQKDLSSTQQHDRIQPCFRKYHHRSLH